MKPSSEWTAGWKPRAAREAARALAWWTANRPLAPDLLERDTRTLSKLASVSADGESVGEGKGDPPRAPIPVRIAKVISSASTDLGVDHQDDLRPDRVPDAPSGATKGDPLIAMSLWVGRRPSLARPQLGSSSTSASEAAMMALLSQRSRHLGTSHALRGCSTGESSLARQCVVAASAPRPALRAAFEASS